MITFIVALVLIAFLISVIIPFFKVLFWILVIGCILYVIVKIILYYADKYDQSNKNTGSTTIRYISTEKDYVKDGVYNPPGQHMRILKDSLRIMEETVNPETFFSRMKVAQKEALYCQKEADIIWEGMTCREIYEMLNDEERRDEIVTDFIEKLFDEGKEDNLTYKMHEAGAYMTEDELNYFVFRLDKKKYHFCKVSFEDTNKLYTYITKDKMIKAGDTVTIPVGNEFAPDYRIRQVEEVFDSSLDDLDFPVKALRCVDKKLH